MANVVETLAAIADGLPLRMPTVARELRERKFMKIVSLASEVV